ncbi:TPA: hypothetical protein GXZ34_00865 [bacterium]|nr:hypothetical protein [bacterium]
MANIKNRLKNLFNRNKGEKEESSFVSQVELELTPEVDQTESLEVDEEELIEGVTSEENIIVEEESPLSEEETNNHDEIIDIEETKKEELEVVEEDENIEINIVDITSEEYTKIIRENLAFCAAEIKEVSATMDEIGSQKGSESFFKKSENIKTISRHVSRVSDIQQKTLDLLVLLIGASGKMVDDYDTIMQTIDELSELNGGEAEVLNYLLKVKGMVKEIKNNNDHLKSVTEQVNFLSERFKEYDIKIKENNKESLSRIALVNSDMTRYKSALKRLEKKINRNSLYIFITMILIIVLGAALYFLVLR